MPRAKSNDKLRRDKREGRYKTWEEELEEKQKKENEN